MSRDEPTELRVSTHGGLVSEIFAAPDEVADMLAKVQLTVPVTILVRDDREAEDTLVATVWPDGGIDWHTPA